MFLKKSKKTDTAPAPRRQLPELPETLWQALRFVRWRTGSARLPGRHGALYQGFAAHFTGHRPYSPGDDLRFLDQRVLARMEKEVVKLSAIESNLHCAFLLDCSASMDFPAPATKFDAACAIAWTGACLFNRLGDQTSLFPLTGEREKTVPRGQGNRHLASLRTALQSIQPAGKSSLEDGLRETAGFRHHRTAFVVISDFISQAASWLDTLSDTCPPPGDLVLIQVLTREEKELAVPGTTGKQAPRPLTGPVKIIDPESGRRVVINGAQLRRAYTAVVAETSDILERFARERGCLYIQYEPGRDAAPDIWRTIFLNRSGRRP